MSRSTSPTNQGCSSENRTRDMNACLEMQQILSSPLFGIVSGKIKKKIVNAKYLLIRKENYTKYSFISIY
jgi:hypothetical protein